MAMNKFQDYWTRWHHKIVRELKSPSSNNGFIYTAYCKIVGLPFKIARVRDCFMECVESFNPILVYRNPGQPDPPMSKDEWTGLLSLYVVSAEFMRDRNWMMVGTEVKFNLIEFVKQAGNASWDYIKTQDRNYIWKNNLEQLYFILYKYPRADRFYACWVHYNRTAKKLPELYNPLNWVWFFLQAVYNARFGTDSVKNYKYLQLRDMNLDNKFFTNLIKPWITFPRYFGKDHPISKRWLRGDVQWAS